MGAENESLEAFESGLEQLEELVRALEDGDISLQETIRNFEQGMALARRCETLLKQAELRVQTLLEGDESAPLQPFAADDDEPESAP